MTPEVAGGPVPERPSGSVQEALTSWGALGPWDPREDPRPGPGWLTRPEGCRLPVLVVVGEAREAGHAARVVVLQPPEQLAEFLLALLLPQQPHLVLLLQTLPRGTQGRTPHTSPDPTLEPLPAQGARVMALEGSQRESPLPRSHCWSLAGLGPDEAPVVRPVVRR